MPRKKPAGLDPVQAYYVEGHRDRPPADLAAELGVPAALVEAHLATLAPPESRLSRSFDKPRPGVVAMTQAASEAGDDAVKAKGPKNAFEQNRGRWHRIR